MFFADQEKNDPLGEFHFNNQAGDQETADEEEDQLDFIHIFVFSEP